MALGLGFGGGVGLQIPSVPMSGPMGNAMGSGLTPPSNALALNPPTAPMNMGMLNFGLGLMNQAGPHSVAPMMPMQPMPQWHPAMQFAQLPQPQYFKAGNGFF